MTKMETKYYPHGWIRILDIGGIVIAPLIFTLPIFFLVIVAYRSASSTGSDYTGAIAILIGALGILIIFGCLFGWALKRYICHQATRDEVKAFRFLYSGFILGSLFLYSLFYVLFLML